MFHTVLSAMGESAWQVPPLTGLQFPQLHMRGLEQTDHSGSPSSCCWQRGVPDSGQGPRGDLAGLSLQVAMTTCTLTHTL